MDRSHTDADLDRDLESWFTDTAPWRARDGLLAEVLDRTGAVGQRRHPRPWDRLLAGLAPSLPRPVVIAIAVLLIAALGIGAVVAGSAVLPSILPPPVPTGPVWTGFQRLPDTSAFGTRTVADVIPTSGGYTAIGGIVNGSANVAAAWTSTDGVTWTESPSDPVFTDSVMTRLARHGSSVVAIGQDCSGGIIALCKSSRFAVSTDGRTWHGIVAAADPVGPGVIGSDYETITATPNGFVVAGTWSDPSDTSPVNATFASSADGSHWVAVTPSVALFAERTVAGVAAAPTGMVAVGADASLDAVVWTSVDATTWTLEPISGLTGGRPRDVAWANGMFVAVGSDGVNAVAWTSPDGTAWTAARTSAVLAGGQMTRIIGTGSAFLALGSSAAGDGVAWVSLDGRAWSRVDTGTLFQGAAISTGVVVGSRLELFGTDSNGRLVAAISAP